MPCKFVLRTLAIFDNFFLQFLALTKATEIFLPLKIIGFCCCFVYTQIFSMPDCCGLWPFLELAVVHHVDTNCSFEVIVFVVLITEWDTWTNRINWGSRANERANYTISASQFASICDEWKTGSHQFAEHRKGPLMMGVLLGENCWVKAHWYQISQRCNLANCSMKIVRKQ